MKKLTTNEFIERAKEVHGEKYDYSVAEYNGMFFKVSIICPSHGEFLQTAHNHLKKRGCIPCGGTCLSNGDEFKKKSIIIHGNKYRYQSVVYKTNNEDVVIYCKIHGNFNQTPNSHLNGSGCPKCANNVKYSNDEFIKKCKDIHGDTFDYSAVVYDGVYKKIKITCKKHGGFLQIPHNHLCGMGCPKCSKIISCPEIQFLEHFNIPDTNHARQVRILKRRVDGYDEKTNTVYEFLGDYWHGNPTVYDPADIHPKRKVTYGVLYEETIKNLTKLSDNGYNVIFVWEYDWKQWISTDKKSPLKTNIFSPNVNH